MKVLWVDACVRAEESRTRRLAEAFLSRLCDLRDDAVVERHDLSAMSLQPLTRAALASREAVCDGRCWSEPSVQPALQLQQADLVLIAAPYWDLSFPSCLKVWVEHMWVRNLTFVYRDDQPVGLLNGKHTVYITTSGSPIGAFDFGAEYIRAVSQTLGIRGFSRLSAEALDLDTSDTVGILAEAERRIRAEAGRLAAIL